MWLATQVVRPPESLCFRVEGCKDAGARDGHLTVLEVLFVSGHRLASMLNNRQQAIHQWRLGAVHRCTEYVHRDRLQHESAHRTGPRRLRDAQNAIKAARAAFTAWSETPVATREELVVKFLDAHKAKKSETEWITKRESARW